MRRTGETFTPYHYSSVNCMELFHRYAKPGCSVLDVGTGTGILAIKAKEAGAGRVLAVDILAESVEDAKYNAAEAGVDIEVRRNYLNFDINERFDITIANLYANPAVEFLQYAERTMAEDGILILTWLSDISWFRIEEWFRIIDKAGEDREYVTYALKRRQKHDQQID